MRNRSCGARKPSPEMTREVVPPAPRAPPLAQCAGNAGARHDSAPRLRLTDHRVWDTIALRRSARGAIEIVPPTIRGTARIHRAVLLSAACQHRYDKGRRADGCRYQTSVVDVVRRSAPGRRTDLSQIGCPGYVKPGKQ